MPTKTEEGCITTSIRHTDPINKNFLIDFSPGKLISKSPGYRGSCGADRMTIVGEIISIPGTIKIPDNFIPVMNYCQILDRPILAHYMFTAIFCRAKKIVLRYGSIIKRSTKGDNISYFETQRFLFIEQNKNKASKYGRKAQDGDRIMWIIRREDNTYIGRVENGILYKL